MKSDTARSHSAVRLGNGCRTTSGASSVRGDELLAGQNSRDRRHRHGHVVVVLKMPGDRVRAGVETLPADGFVKLIWP